MTSNPRRTLASRSGSELRGKGTPRTVPVRARGRDRSKRVFGCGSRPLCLARRAPAGRMGDDAWQAELEAECGKAVPRPEKVREVCREHGVPPALRARVWQVLLGVVNRKANLEAWWEDEDIAIEDLQVVKADVGRTRQDMPKFKDAEVQREMEKLLLIYCKRRSVKYTQGLNELLAPFVDLRAEVSAADAACPFGRDEIFNSFYGLVHKFLPNTLRGHDLKTLRRSLQLVRMVLRYHYPRLATLLETAGLGPDFYATSWLVTLFASTNEMPMVHLLWDQLLIHDDPSIVYFMVVAMVAAQEQALLAAEGQEDQLMTLLKGVGTVADAAQVSAILERAVRLSISTPRSFRRLVHRATIQDEPNDHLDALLHSSAPSVTLVPADLAHLVGGHQVRVLACCSACVAHSRACFHTPRICVPRNRCAQTQAHMQAQARVRTRTHTHTHTHIRAEAGTHARINNKSGGNKPCRCGCWTAAMGQRCRRGG